MPNITLHLSEKYSRTQKKQLADALSAEITAIKGKKQSDVMTVIHDDSYIQLGDQYLENGAFISINCFGKAAAEDNEAYAKKVFEVLESQLGIQSKDVYITLDERSWWGTAGQVTRIS